MPAVATRAKEEKQVLAAYTGESRFRNFAESVFRQSSELYSRWGVDPGQRSVEVVVGSGQDIKGKLGRFHPKTKSIDLIVDPFKVPATEYYSGDKFKITFSDTVDYYLDSALGEDIVLAVGARDPVLFQAFITGEYNDATRKKFCEHVREVNLQETGWGKEHAHLAFHPQMREFAMDLAAVCLQDSGFVSKRMLPTAVHEDEHLIFATQSKAGELAQEIERDADFTWALKMYGEQFKNSVLYSMIEKAVESESDDLNPLLQELFERRKRSLTKFGPEYGSMLDMYAAICGVDEALARAVSLKFTGENKKPCPRLVAQYATESVDLTRDSYHRVLEFLERRSYRRILEMKPRTLLRKFYK